MQEKEHGDEEQHPRQIEQRGRPRTGDEAAKLFEVARGLGGVAAGHQPGDHQHDLVDARFEFVVDGEADMAEDLPAHEIEHALKEIGRADDRQQAEQRRLAAPGYHQIIDEDHVDRPCEQQDVQHRADDADGDRRAAQLRRDFRKRIRRRLFFALPHRPVLLSNKGNDRRTDRPGSR
jgi:hypothetical protein